MNNRKVSLTLTVILISLVALGANVILKASTKKQAKSIMTTFDFPIGDGITPEGYQKIADCTGEELTLYGNFKFMFHVVTLPNGGMRVNAQGNPQGAYGIGMTTGTKYNVNGAFKQVEHVNVSPQEQMSLTNNFVIVGLGSAKSLRSKHLSKYSEVE